MVRRICSAWKNVEGKKVNSGYREYGGGAKEHAIDRTYQRRTLAADVDQALQALFVRGLEKRARAEELIDAGDSRLGYVNRIVAGDTPQRAQHVLSVVVQVCRILALNR